MNEFRKGLRKGFISLACALDAADEIERLEAERDALRAELAAERDHHADALEMNNLLQKDKAELRAELAAEREKTADLGKQIDRLADEIDWIEDEVVTQEKALEEDEAERDALRKLLREALAHLKTGQWTVPTDITLMSRIDAALNKGGE